MFFFTKHLQKLYFYDNIKVAKQNKGENNVKI